MITLIGLTITGAAFMTYALLTLGGILEIQSNTKRIEREINYLKSENGWMNK